MGMSESTMDQHVLSDVVRLACRAPSVHNTQPWRLVAENGELRLFLDPHRVPHATDLSGRESVISCGALLHHLGVAAAAAGWKANVARFPNPNDLDHLATIDFRRQEFVSEADQARAGAILRRRSDRLLPRLLGQSSTAGPRRAQTLGERGRGCRWHVVD